MENILIFSSGTSSRALIAEALLETQIKQGKNIVFYSCGIEYIERDSILY